MDAEILKQLDQFSISDDECPPTAVTNRDIHEGIVESQQCVWMSSQWQGYEYWRIQDCHVKGLLLWSF